MARGQPTGRPPMRDGVRTASPRMAVWLVLVLALLTGARNEPTQQLQPMQNLPVDVAEATANTWERFARAFPARLDCMGPVELELVRDVDGGDAVYRQDEARILIEIPTSPQRYPESLVHELGHHLASSCADAELRSSFLAAQRFPAVAAWQTGERWQDIPAEHFAEAVVAIVNGKRLLHTELIEVTPGSLDLLRAWGADGP